PASCSLPIEHRAVAAQGQWAIVTARAAGLAAMVMPLLAELQQPPPAELRGPLVPPLWGRYGWIVAWSPDRVDSTIGARVCSRPTECRRDGNYKETRIESHPQDRGHRGRHGAVGAHGRRGVGGAGRGVLLRLLVPRPGPDCPGVQR